ncbi:heterokaryon incompatibility protein-domain-containing protein [Immersiella caudata]|uniref:Heterokaryon incompatibility protein-domain-containing protein n=1 Tax=Immersiella caudata TaxID=314043 RepID=A0AA39WBY6_9PEZI|nr:heterokaryon incompatibility protein-domain-containing protein [Immersiella caudata]
METEDDVYTENEDYLTANREAVRRSEEYKHHHYDGQQWSTRERSHGRKDAEWFIPEPEVADDSDPEYLCEMCRHIDFRVVFTRRGVPGNIEPGVSAIKIRAPSVLQASNCSFCSLIRQGFQTQWTQKEMEIAENAERIGMQLAVLDDGPESALRLEVTLADGFTDMKPRLVLQMMTPESTIPLRGLPVDREVADMGRLRTWIQTCEEHHTDEVNKFEPSTWRFIDVEEERIASAEATCRYTCLSYVWGHKKGTQLTTETLAILEKPGGLRDSSVALGKTLRNAMKVTKDIGIRYLWIDALCIIQNDAEDKRRCISRMSHIYGNATVNIVASTNSCPSEGLPGVGDTPRIRAQVVRKLQGITLSAAFHDPRLPLEGIEGSVWNSRAWTFQERHLSPRSVYFTDSQMYFTCRHEVVFEDTVPGLPEDHQPRQLLDTSQFRGRIWDIVPFISLDPTQAYYPNKTFHIHGQGSQAKNIISDDPSIPAPIYHAEPALIPAGGGFLRIHGETMWKAYADAVGMYTGRKMTWQTDALNAFHGVSDLLAQGVNTTFWHGLPEYNFDQALLWYPREPLRRRNHEGASPSWSWAGWEGHTGYRGRGWYNALAMPPVTVIKWLRHKTPRDLIYDYLTDGKHHTPEEIADQAFLIARQQSKVFYINIPTLFHFDPDDNWTHCRDTERNEHYYTHPEYPGLRFTYPTTLPSQKIIPKAQVHGFLFFQARHVPVSFVDITKTPHNPAPRVDHFLQIGKTNPAIQGRTRFRPWEHAIYHQGYRAGFLSLNVPLSDLDVPGDEGAAAVDTASSNASKYHIVPISRESLPSIAPPVEGWEEYWNSNPRYQQSVVMKWEWGREEQRWQAVGPSEEAQKPYRGQCLENGDPRWDVARFGLPVELDVYNVLLLEKLPGGNYKRVGVGKMNAHAFWHAHPEEGIFVLS